MSKLFKIMLVMGISLLHFYIPDMFEDPLQFATDILVIVITAILLITITTGD